MVSTQAQIRLTVTPQRTAEIRFVRPTPIIEPVMVCVVLTGTLKCSVKYNVKAPAVSAVTPSKEETLVFLEPIVLTIFQQPLGFLMKMISAFRPYYFILKGIKYSSIIIYECIR